MGLAVSLPPLSKVTGDEKLDIKEKRPKNSGETEDPKCPWDPFSGSALGRILRADSEHAPSHPEEAGDLSVQATARARLVPYFLYAVLRETSGIRSKVC